MKEAAIMASSHILFTALGAQPIRGDVLYQMGDKNALAPLAPLALLKLLPEEQRPNRVIALVTEKAREMTWSPFKEGVRELLKLEAESIDVPDGKTEEDIQVIIEKSAKALTLEQGDELTLDITHGLRSFPFVAYPLALYLTTLRGVKLRGAYYGMLEGFGPNSAEPRPILDLRPLLDLPEWFYAVRVFQDTGSTRPLTHLVSHRAELLKSESQEARKRLATCDDKATSEDFEKLREPANTAGKLFGQFSDLWFAYESALPLELGKASLSLSTSVERSLPAVMSRLPLSDVLAAVLQDSLRPLALRQPPREEGKWKTFVALNRPELERQACLIDLYFEKKQFPSAIGLLREWTVSWVMFHQDEGAEWLSVRKRARAEKRLGALAAARTNLASNELSRQQQEWARYWDLLSQARNALHHHGMRQDALSFPLPMIDKIREFWRSIRRDKSGGVPALGGGRGKLLITAVGNRPGVLYSALGVFAPKPDRSLVICSKQSEPLIPEALKRAAFAGEHRTLRVDDPHGGFEEIKALCKAAERWLLEADEIVANMTGGTTLMGIVVQKLVETGDKLDRPHRRFALIDSRPPGEQDADPWVQSGCRWLDPSRDDSGEA